MSTLQRTNSTHRQTGIYADLDEEVEKLRAILDDPLRVAEVSSTGFPLQVWERMFALDRERRAARAVEQQDEQQQQQREHDSDDENNHDGKLHDNGGDQRDDEGDTKSRSRRSPSRASSSSAPSSGFTSAYSGLSLKRKAPMLRNCRDGKMNAKFMQELVKDSFAKDVGSIEEGRKLTCGKNHKDDDAASVEPTRSRNLFLLDEEEQEEKDGKTDCFGNNTNNKRNFNEKIPKAILHHIEVPVRMAAAAPSPAPSGLSSSLRLHQNRNLDAVSAKNTATSLQPKSAEKPILAFAPVYSMWGPIGGSTVAAVEQQRSLNRIQAMSRPVVERHDLPFEVTPANDFRQLAFPLVGLGHAVPYGDLLHEQRSMMNMCGNK